MAAKVTCEDLRDALPAGVTLGATEFPDADPAIKAVVAILEAYQTAQTAQNGSATPGEISVSLVVGTGQPTTITRDGASYNVIPRGYNLSTFLQLNYGQAFEQLQ